MIRKKLMGKTEYSGKKAAAVILTGLLLTGLLTGCGMLSTDDIPSPVVGDETKNEFPVVYGPGSYDSADTPILVKKDEEKMTLTFLLMLRKAILSNTTERPAFTTATEVRYQ